MHDACMHTHSHMAVIVGFCVSGPLLQRGIRMSVVVPSHRNEGVTN